MKQRDDTNPHVQDEQTHGRTGNHVTFLNLYIDAYIHEPTESNVMECRRLSLPFVVTD